MRFFDLRNSACFLDFECSDSPLTSLDYSEDGFSLYLGCSDGSISKFDMRNSSLVSSLLVKRKVNLRRCMTLRMAMG